MDIDLLFIAIPANEWRNISEEGQLKPSDENTFIRSYQGERAEEIINKTFDGEDELLLLILDPSRIEAPIKHIKEDGFSYVDIQGAVPLDTIIDKIKLKKNKNNAFSVRVKHFD